MTIVATVLLSVGRVGRYDGRHTTHPSYTVEKLQTLYLDSIAVIIALF